MEFIIYLTPLDKEIINSVAFLIENLRGSKLWIVILRVMFVEVKDVRNAIPGGNVWEKNVINVLWDGN